MEINWILEEFPNSNIQYINYNKNKYFYYVRIYCKEISELTSSITNLGNINIFSIFENYVLIDKLIKCNNMNGNKILESIKTLAYKFKCKSIYLTDGSNIILDNCKLNLSKIYILQYGYSWYNSKGFYSSNFENEKNHNFKIINLNINNYLIEYYDLLNIQLNKELIDSLYNLKIKKNINNEIENYYKIEKYNIENRLINEYIELISLFKLILNELKIISKFETINFTELFNIIMPIIKNDNIKCENTKVIFVQKIIKIIKNDLIYDSELKFKL